MIKIRINATATTFRLDDGLSKEEITAALNAIEAELESPPAPSKPNPEPTIEPRGWSRVGIVTPYHPDDEDEQVTAIYTCTMSPKATQALQEAQPVANGIKYGLDYQLEASLAAGHTTTGRYAEPPAVNESKEYRIHPHVLRRSAQK